MPPITWKRTSVLISFLLSFFPATATHIVGGELNYRFLGNDLYEIRLTVYRDCYNGVPPFDSPASVGVFDANNNLVTQLLMAFRGSDTIPPTINSPCFIPPLDICYEVTTYIDTMALPPIPGGYQLAYQRCCRNMTLLNIINPTFTGATYYAHIPPPSITPVNSNPKFTYWPPPFICVNVKFEFDHSAIDYDGDSITYEICNPYEGATYNAPQPQPPNNPPYTSVTWQPPYNPSNLLGGVALTINSATGFLTCTPNTIGQFVVGICANEFRNGVLLSKTRRDFQLNVVNCPTLLVAALQTPLVVCGSYEVKFQNNSIGASTYYWDFGDPTTLADTSNALAPSYTYPDTGYYNITLIAYSNVNQGCADTTVGVVHLVPDYVVAADFDTTLCSYDVVFTDTTLSTGSGLTNQWLWNFGDNASTNLHNPVHTYTNGGNYLVSFIATSDFGCIDTVLMLVPVPDLVKAVPQSVTGVTCYGDCDGEGTVFAFSGTPSYTYQWNDTLGQTATTATGLCAGSYIVTVTDTDGCTDTAIVQIPTPPPLLDSIFATDAYCGGMCYGTATSFPSGGTPPYQFQWNDPSQQTSAGASGLCQGIYDVLITDQHGCTFTDQAAVLYSDTHPAVDATADDYTIFYGLSTQLHALMAAGYSYLWSPASSISNVNDPNPVVTPLDSIWYFLTITDSNGCTNIDSVLIKVRIPLCDEPEIFIPNAFTPNNDAKNDRVYVRGTYITDLYFVIYDRWGEKVFETTDQKKGWDGKYKGQLAHPGVFVYYVEATCSDQKKFFKKGNITLIR